MDPYVLPVPTRSVRWIVVPIALLNLYATWSYVQERSYWTASLQFLMLAFLPIAFKYLTHLPTAVKFDENSLYIVWGDYESVVSLSHIEAIKSTFFNFNQRSIFQVRYSDNGKKKIFYVFGGLALSTLDEQWKKQ
jgi:hypothetical protein